MIEPPKTKKMAKSLVYPSIFLAMSESYANGGKDVALLIDPQGQAVKAIGIASSNSPYETRSAIVNLVQNIKPKVSRDGAKEDFIVLATSTAPPWYRDQGLLEMAPGWRGKKPAILFYDWKDNKTVYLRTWTNPPDGGGHLIQWDNQGRAGGRWRALLNKYKSDGLPSAWIKLEDVYPAGAFSGTAYTKNLRLCANWYATNKGVNISLIQTFGTAERYDTYATAPVLNLPPNLSPPAIAKDSEALINEIFELLSWGVVQQSIFAKAARRIPDGHNIGSVLRAPDDQLAGWGINTNGGAMSYSLHGEVNLLQNRQRSNGNAAAALPNGTTLYSTLEPCYMCAGMYTTEVERKDPLADPTLVCHYGQKDPGIPDRNYLNQRKYNTSQSDSPNKSIVGRNIGVIYKRDTKTYLGENPKRRSLPITVFLTRDLALRQIREASTLYFRLLPKKPNSRERTIWENGLKLLYSIDPGIEVVWKRQKTHYDGVI